LPIGKITAHFAHRFFSIQEKFAHYSKNLGCATDFIRLQLGKNPKKE